MRHDRSGIGAHPLADETEPSESWNQFVEETKHRFVERDIDILAEAGVVAMAQGEQGAERAVQSREIVAKAHRALGGRLATGIAGEIRDAAEGMGDAREAGAVLVRTGLAVSRNTDHDETRVDR